MVTHEKAGANFVRLKRNGFQIAVLGRRTTKTGVEFYDWTTGISYGSDLDQICITLEKEMENATSHRPGVNEAVVLPRDLLLIPGGRSSSPT